MRGCLLGRMMCGVGLYYASRLSVCEHTNINFELSPERLRTHLPKTFVNSSQTDEKHKTMRDVPPALYYAGTFFFASQVMLELLFLEVSISGNTVCLQLLFSSSSARE